MKYHTDIGPCALVVMAAAATASADIVNVPGLAENDDMVEAFTADRSDHPLNERVLPGRTWRNHDFLDSHVLEPLLEAVASSRRPRGSLGTDVGPIAPRAARARATPRAIPTGLRNARPLGELDVGLLEAC